MLGENFASGGGQLESTVKFVKEINFVNFIFSCKFKIYHPINWERQHQGWRT